MQRRASFTLLEILIVIVIVAMLMAVAIPRMGGTFAVTQLKGAARDVTGLLRYARDYAVITERTCEVRFAPEEDAYQLVALDKNLGRYDRKNRSLDPHEKVAEMMLGDDASGVRKLPARVHFEVIYSDAPLTEDKGLPCVIYYPDGSATPATIAIQDEKRHAISVQVFRTTGMARVSQGLPVEEPKEKKLYYGPDKS